MEYVYVLVDDSEWEDIVIYLSEKEAIDISNKYPNSRVEIFSKKTDIGGYTPLHIIIIKVVNYLYPPIKCIIIIN